MEYDTLIIPRESRSYSQSIKVWSVRDKCHSSWNSINGRRNGNFHCGILKAKAQTHKRHSIYIRLIQDPAPQEERKLEQQAIPQLTMLELNVTFLPYNWIISGSWKSRRRGFIGISILSSTWHRLFQIPTIPLLSNSVSAEERRQFIKVFVPA